MVMTILFPNVGFELEIKRMKYLSERPGRIEIKFTCSRFFELVS